MMTAFAGVFDDGMFVAAIELEREDSRVLRT